MLPPNTSFSVIFTPYWVAAPALIVGLLLVLLPWLVMRRRGRQLRALQAELEAERGHPREDESLREAYLQFIHNISHEVSNPLQSVQTNLENMATCSPAETGRWKQYHAILQQEVRRLFKLTDNLRLLSRLEHPSQPVRRQPVNLKSVIEDVIMNQAERASQRNIHLNYQGPGHPAQVLANREHLFQLILNLVDNSIKYAKESGGEIEIALREDADCMQIVIVDEGIGIPRDDLPFIFDTAYRSPSTGSLRRTGSGLGLAIVKRIVSEHEGTIKVDSTVGEGTRFTLTIPIYKPVVEE